MAEALATGAMPSCATDTTDDSTRLERRSRSKLPSAMSPLGSSYGYGGITQPAPDRLTGGVSLGRIMAVVGSSLALVATLTVASHRSMLVSNEQLLGVVSASSSDPAHPRLAKLEIMSALVQAASSAEEAVLGGVDVVAFYDLAPGADPVFGTEASAYTLKTEDAFSPAVFESTFWFSSDENRALFEANPAQYAPRYGGFCAFGITSELNGRSREGMDTAGVTDGWAWARDYLGPPADVKNWAIVDGKLYFTFLPPVMDAFLAGGPALAEAGEERWARWFGESQPDGLQNGPYNTECLAAGYGPPVTRTCTWEPQASGLKAGFSSVSSEPCTAALDAHCGEKQGNDPVELDLAQTCSQCLLDNFEKLSEAGCSASESAIATAIDKAYCW